MNSGKPLGTLQGRWPGKPNPTSRENVPNHFPSSSGTLMINTYLTNLPCYRVSAVTVFTSPLTRTFTVGLLESGPARMRYAVTFPSCHVQSTL